MCSRERTGDMRLWHGVWPLGELRAAKGAFVGNDVDNDVEAIEWDFDDSSWHGSNRV
jgi:hypothetical protein